LDRHGQAWLDAASGARVGFAGAQSRGVRQIPAETEATVVRIHMLPGSLVKADTVLIEMSNPQTEQAAVDAQLQLKAAAAEYQSLRVKLESDLMNQKAGAATVSADHAQAQRQAETDKALYGLGVISGLAYKSLQRQSRRIDDQERPGESVQELLSKSDGLVLVRGRWVEVDAERLSRTLAHFDEIERKAAGVGSGKSWPELQLADGRENNRQVDTRGS
jgi:multidrug efflux pump subunit AcrA (membrane-fusion protein)